MLRVSRLTDYGTLVMSHMARLPERVHSANDLAAALGLGTPTVSKILKSLARHRLVTGVRGTRGGYSLERAPELITLADIVDALEDRPFGLTECSATAGVCDIEEACRIRANWRSISGIVRRALEDVSLADMVGPEPLERPAGVNTIGKPLSRAGAAASAQELAAIRSEMTGSSRT
jgi:FeS assembly SUF system regulator